MNLFELKEEKEDVESDIRYYKKEIERLEIKTGVKATDCSKLLVDGSRIMGATEEAIIELTQMEIDLEDAIKKLDNLKNLVNDKYNNYKKHNDYDKKIYTEKKLFKWSNAKISAKHNGISRTQIWNIIKKIENSSEKISKK